MTTRAPSPCSADSSSEASAKEEATQGKPTDDKLPAEIEGAFEAYGIACYSAGGEADGDTMAEQVALKNAILAALRASQADLLGTQERAYNLAIATDAAERERDAARAEASELRSEHVMTRLEQRVIEAERERDALREALLMVSPWERRDGSPCWCDEDGICVASEACEKAHAALAPRPPCSAEATQGKPVKEE